MKKIIVSISSGIDSLVSAFLLKKNFDILGINFFTGFESKLKKLNLRKKISKISKKLKINIRIINIKKQFKKIVVKYFFKTYKYGKTPNPCIVCNEKIKFGLLLNAAKKNGACKIATGHYARIFKDLNNNLYISKGFDKKKDQSYFLSRLHQKNISFILFPIGNITKKQVIKIAIDNKLKINNVKESQDICFIKNMKHINLFKNWANSQCLPKNIINTNGVVLSKHKGIFRYTIGQGLKIKKKKINKKFVIKIIYNKNKIVVDLESFLSSKTCYIVNTTWSSNIPEFPICVYAKIRYKHLITLAVIYPTNANSAIVYFQFPQLSITPGQCIVFYQKKHIIGSGWIK